MVSANTVTKQLKQIGCDYTLWGKSETSELPHVLMQDEQIMQAVNGYYEGGFALLCTTNYRVLLIDKKPLALTVEDLRYDMIAEVDYSSRIFTSVLHIYTPMRTLNFTSWSMARLRKNMSYIQQRVMELRNNDFLSSQFAQQPSSSVSQSFGQTGRPMLQRQGVPQMVPTVQGTNQRPAEFEPARPSQRSSLPLNPYTKVPLLARRRRYPAFYL